jgi:hypothetical protein
LEVRNDGVIVDTHEVGVPTSKDMPNVENFSRVELSNGLEMESDILFGLNVPRATPMLAFASLAQKIIDDISNHMKIKDVSQSRSNLTTLDKKRLQYAEKMLRDACMELYRGLNLLKSFRLDAFLCTWLNTPNVVTPFTTS